MRGVTKPRIGVIGIAQWRKRKVEDKQEKKLKRVEDEKGGKARSRGKGNRGRSTRTVTVMVSYQALGFGIAHILSLVYLASFYFILCLELLWTSYISSPCRLDFLLYRTLVLGD